MIVKTSKGKNTSFPSMLLQAFERLWQFSILSINSNIGEPQRWTQLQIEVWLFIKKNFLSNSCYYYNCFSAEFSVGKIFYIFCISWLTVGNIIHFFHQQLKSIRIVKVVQDRYRLIPDKKPRNAILSLHTREPSMRMIGTVQINVLDGHFVVA